MIWLYPTVWVSLPSQSFYLIAIGLIVAIAENYMYEQVSSIALRCDDTDS
jgi:hypothetical protein